MVGTATGTGKLTYHGIQVDQGLAPGTMYALSNSQLGIIYRPSSIPKIFVKTNISGTTATGISLTTGDYPKTTHYFGLIPVDLTISNLSFNYKGKSGSVNIVTNPSTCGPATSTMTFTPWSGAPGSKTSTFTVTGCGPVDTTPPVVTITSPADGSTTTDATTTVSYTATDDSGAAPTCSPPNGSSVPLALGPNTITVTCSDAAGNTASASVSVTRVAPPDTEAPVVTITSPVDGSTVTTDTVTLEYDVTDNEDPSPTCDLADGSTVTLVEGPNTITVNCTDDAGNTGTDSVTVTYTPIPPPDTEAPVVTITSPVDGSTVTTDTVTLEYDVTDNEDLSPTCDLADGSSVTLVEGPNTITVNCTDDAGNTGSDSVTVTYTPIPPPDTEAPVVTITAPVDGSTVTTDSVVVEYDVTDNEDPTPTCDIADGSTVTLVEGPNTITVNCTDDAGNTGTDAVTVTYDPTPPPDTQPPVVTITSPSDGFVTDQDSIVVEYDVTDNMDSTPTCDLADGATVSLVEGPNVITVNCSDDAGNTGSDSVTVTYTPIPPPDTEAPVVTITAPVDGSTVTTDSVVVEYDVADNMDLTPTCDIADGATVPLVPGPNTITVNCTDDAGNTGSDSVSVTYDVPDTEAPVVTITSPIEGQVFTTDSATVEYDVTDNEDLTPTCDIADGATVPLVPGPNTITVNCTDDAGNTGTDSVNVTYNPTPPPDTEPPVVTITSPVDGSTVTTDSVVVEYDVTDNMDTTPTCDLADGATVPLVPGPNTITVTCSDDAGNLGSDSVTVTYDVPDTEPPVVTITSPVDGSTVTTDTVTLEYDVTDNEDASPTCDLADGSTVTLTRGSEHDHGQLHRRRRQHRHRLGHSDLRRAGHRAAGRDHHVASRRFDGHH